VLFDAGQQGRGIFRAKQDGVIAGLPVAERVFAKLDPSVRFESFVGDGSLVNTGTVIADAHGPVKSLLTGERLALNLLQRMSGIATLSRKYVEAVAGLPVKILDTRKTVPGLRYLDKYAVRCGGATNHRLNLNELAMVKDNHLKAAGGIAKAVAKIRAGATIRIEVECANLDQVREALAAGADIIMLDNMDVATMREAVKLIAKRAQVEASGNISLENVRTVATTGVDFISIGKLTHSVAALDISMKLA
jgi:nicotinate-nucleotide pyrophosphorylase (carboxylating)